MSEPMIPQSGLFKAIQEAVKAGASVEFEESGFMGLAVKIIDYREDTAGREAHARGGVWHEQEAEEVVREWLATIKPLRPS